MWEALLSVVQAFFGRVQGRDDLLEQPLRRRIYGIIQRHPGIHASELCRESGEAWGTVQYHLQLLRKGDLVQSLEAGRERRFFPPDIDPEEAHVVSVLNQGRRHEIFDCIRENPGIRQVDVCNAVAVSRKTFRSSIRALVDEGLIQERKGLQTNRYFAIAEPPALPVPEPPGPEVA